MNLSLSQELRDQGFQKRMGFFFLKKREHYRLFTPAVVRNEHSNPNSFRPRDLPTRPLAAGNPTARLPAPGPGDGAMRRQPFSRHDGFFASLQRVEDRLTSEQHQHQEQDPAPPPPPATACQPGPAPFSDTLTTASPLLLLDPAQPSVAASRDSSGPALDFLTALTDQEQDDDDDDSGGDGVEEDIARLMALLGLSPPPPDGDDGCDAGGGTGGCDCSGADGFLAKVVGVAGPKCDGEKRRLDAWIRHYYHRREGGGCRVREPARLAHLLLARASSSDAAAAVVAPATVVDFLERDPK